MVKRHIKKARDLVERRRFRLLLSATLLVLILPAFFGKGLLNTILFVISLTFLLIQSMIIANVNRPSKIWIRSLFIIILILLYWLDPLGIKSEFLDVAKFFLLVFAFVAVTYYLFLFLKKSKDVNIDVILVSINIYLLLGIVFGSLSFLFNELYNNAYNFPSNLTDPNFTTFVYYSFITMSTVGYGDVTPRIPETQTLAYFISVTGQLYVAIIVAFLVGKLLVKGNDSPKKEK